MSLLRRALQFGAGAVPMTFAVRATWLTAASDEHGPPRIFNLHVAADDFGTRVSATYFLKRAWVRITRDLVTTDMPLTVPLDLRALAQRPFAVCWLWHSAMLLRIGGWVVAHVADAQLRRFYFAGDTAFVQALFHEIHARVSAIDLAALPIGAYQPRPLMLYEHTDPDDAVRAQEELNAALSFRIHWGCFQLDGEEFIQPAGDLDTAVRQHNTSSFGLMVIDAVLDIQSAAAGGAASPWIQPAGLVPVHTQRKAAPVTKWLHCSWPSMRSDFQFERGPYSPIAGSRHIQAGRLKQQNPLFRTIHWIAR